MRRMSPAPFSNPKALLYVGAATTKVAAKAPNSPRRENPPEVVFVILSDCPSLAFGHSAVGSWLSRP
jgi:hypothetical protein